MNEMIEALTLVGNLPQSNNEWGAATKQDLAAVHQHIASLVNANAVWFGVAIALGILALIAAAGLALWCWRLRGQVKTLLATRVQMKDCSGQLIMDVPLELLKTGYKFTVPQPVLNAVMEQAT